MFITNDIKYVGVNDHEIDLFEGQFTVPNGMAYNSYVITDEKTAVMDTVDARFTAEWLGNIESVLGGRKPDYLVVPHMEPDPSANIVNFLTAYPETTVIANSKTLTMMKNFFDYDFDGKVQLVEDGSSISLGRHELTFVFAPMVHWRIRCSSPPTASANSAPSMLTRSGTAKPVATISASSANTALRCRACSKKPQRSI